MTRSKAWLRVCGYGDKMKGLTNEFKKVKENDFKLDFIYRTLEEREKMNIINRDMTDEEKKAVSNTAKSLNELTHNFYRVAKYLLKMWILTYLNN